MILNIISFSLIFIVAAMTSGTAAPSSNTDLGAVLALNNRPCGQVVSSDKRGDQEWIAHCSDKHNYHIFTDQKGRVVVENQY